MIISFLRHPDTLPPVGFGSQSAYLIVFIYNMSARPRLSERHYIGFTLVSKPSKVILCSFYDVIFFETHRLKLQVR